MTNPVWKVVDRASLCRETILSAGAPGIRKLPNEMARMRASKELESACPNHQHVFTTDEANRVLDSALGLRLVTLFYSGNYPSLREFEAYGPMAKCNCSRVFDRCTTCRERVWPWQLVRFRVTRDFPRYWDVCVCLREYRFDCQQCAETKLAISIPDPYPSVREPLGWEPKTKRRSVTKPLVDWNGFLIIA